MKERPMSAPRPPLDPQVEKILSSSEHAGQLEAKEQDRLIAELKKTEIDKELFDPERLQTLHDFTDDHDQSRMTTEYAKDLERKYYLWYPKMKTLEAFADHLKELEANSGG